MDLNLITGGLFCNEPFIFQFLSSRSIKRDFLQWGANLVLICHNKQMCTLYWQPEYAEAASPDSHQRQSG